MRLTCKEKSLRAGAGYGEVRWDTAITNQDGEAVASYDVLTMVSEQELPDALTAPSRAAPVRKAWPRVETALISVHTASPGASASASTRALGDAREHSAPADVDLHQHRPASSLATRSRCRERVAHAQPPAPAAVARMTSRASTCRRTRAPGLRAAQAHLQRAGADGELRAALRRIHRVTTPSMTAPTRSLRDDGLRSPDAGSPRCTGPSVEHPAALEQHQVRREAQHLVELVAHVHHRDREPSRSASRYGSTSSRRAEVQRGERLIQQQQARL